MARESQKLRSSDACRAIDRLVETFIARCAAALEILGREDYDSFDRAFRRQQIAWANLDALITKARLEGTPNNLLVDDEMVRCWITRCQAASAELSQKMKLVIVVKQASSIKSGSVRRALGSFKSVSVSSHQSSNFLKRV